MVLTVVHRWLCYYGGVLSKDTQHEISLDQESNQQSSDCHETVPTTCTKAAPSCTSFHSHPNPLLFRTLGFMFLRTGSLLPLVCLLILCLSNCFWLLVVASGLFLLSGIQSSVWWTAFASRLMLFINPIVGLAVGFWFCFYFFLPPLPVVLVKTAFWWW